MSILDVLRLRQVYFIYIRCAFLITLWRSTAIMFLLVRTAVSTPCGICALPIIHVTSFLVCAIFFQGIVGHAGPNGPLGPSGLLV